MSQMLNPQNLDQWLRPKIRFDVEELWAVALSSQLAILESEMIFRGDASGCSIHPREIFRFAIRANAVHLAIAHSHPSGDCTPSMSDLRITEDLHAIGKLLKIPLVDHLILSKSGFCSLRNEGHFRRWDLKKRKAYLKSSN